MNDPRLPEEYRDQLAQAVAPYTAARLSAVSVMKRPRQMSDEELREADTNKLFCGLLDRIERVTRAYNEEKSRRGV